ncbi:glycosyltransferase family 4 protein [Tianweitania sediminis]|uniref:Glycosyltransferase family 4 protein n=1 Tax=Tianweitania sediminis TaxID=1502156 RepID=A0A8J7R1Q9_9HYPH|nr:glycosyltransferase family 4 protein [Tianweitania sediminis]MBP0441203.1 glycosyltransferase family 4 protein [Tianweitania sediminis]
MKIAIVTGHPIPFALGGAENLWWGLQNHIEQETAHSCDIVSLVVPENTLDGLVVSYQAFSELDLSRYDCVISGKYPAWMVRHPNHVCYMLHRLRGLYDTYAGLHEIASPRAAGLATWMADMAGDHGAHDQVLPEFFARYKALRETDLADDVFAFPGPLARAIVHFLDGIALSQARIQRHAAISEMVANRRDYFPPGAKVGVLHPPPHRNDYRCGEGKYFFTSSRLDGPKRLDLIIEAMQFVQADIPLLIAGAGPDEARLKNLAKGDGRVRFLGFVADAEMPALYAGALAVPFTPQDEDYGLITVEAMRSGKPVVTVSDSGGPTEFVRHGETGLVAAPNAKALGDCLNELAQEPDRARQLGERARERVASVTWSAVFDGLMERPTKAARVDAEHKPKLTVATTFPIDPPMGGGQSRVFHLYRHMAHHYDIDIVSLDDTAAAPREIAPGLVEIRIAKSPRHLRYEQKIAEQVGRQPVGDVAAALAVEFTPEYGEALANACATSEAGIACHPYLLEPLRSALGAKPLWYEAQDVEIDVKSGVLAPYAGAGALLQAVEDVEKRAWQVASHVFACAQRDLDRLRSLYGPTLAVTHEVPNGVALEDIRYTAPGKRRQLQAASSLGQPIALFMGSWHQPNIEAVEEILGTAEQMQAVRFIVIGSVCGPFSGRALPPNVDLLGPVSSLVRDDLLAAAHVALNPMRSGSGTNLKMLDYFAAGIPVVSSLFGARGLLVQPDRHFLGFDGSLAEALRRFLSLSDGEVEALVLGARAVVEDRYSWETIAQNFLRAIARNDAPVHRSV